MSAAQDFSTRAVHAGRDLNETSGVSAPIWQTSTFKLPDAAAGARFGAEVAPAEFYTRLGNPTVKLLEAALASLEGGEAALAFSSGMGAIAALLFSNLAAGDHAVFGRALYATTTEVAQKLFPRYGVKADFVDASDLAALRRAVRPETRMIYVESPTNPTLEICDLDGVAAVAKEKGVLAVIDNTFASPYNQNPLRHGFDVVVHSMTKSIGGHSDLTGGAVIGRKEIVERAWQYLKLFGANLSPFEAWLALRGIKTLAVRAARQGETALEVARFLRGHRAVARVHYPGLEEHPGHALARRQMRTFGSMISFEVSGGYAAAVQVIESVRLITLAVSLGGCESLMNHPASMIAGKLGEEALRLSGITPGLVRFSIGLEAPPDLIADLEQALARC